MRTFIKTYRIDIILFVCALVMRLLFLGFQIHAHGGNFVETIKGDDGYFEISNNVLAGHGFSVDTVPPYTPNPLRTPGYIAFIVSILFFTHSYWGVVLIQILIGATTPLLARRVTQRVTNSARIGTWVGAILVVEPYFVLFSTLLYTETLFIFFFLTGIIYLLKYFETHVVRYITLSALLLGIATLIKTTTEYIPFIVAPLIVWALWKHKRKAFIHAILFALIFTATLMPWLYRNWAVYDTIGMSSQPPYNLYVYLAPSVVSLESGQPFNDVFANSSTPAEKSGDVITLTNGGQYTKKAWATILTHPKGLIYSGFTTLISFFTADGMLTVLQHLGIATGAHIAKPALSLLLTNPAALLSLMRSVATSPLVLIILMRLVWVVVTLAFVAGSWRYVTKNRFNSASIFILALVAYFLVTSVVGGLGVTARYRMPVDPFILALALPL